jgi:predicted lipoprotein with Yx(FWY)xxD motif
MTRLVPLSAAIGAALTLAACGGGGGGSSTSSSATSKQEPAGTVLQDRDGKALYASDQEAKGKVLCTTDSCLAFWKPAKPGSVASSADAGKLTVIKRPDGARQLAAGSKPLYTFSEDSPGKVTGDGFSDDFGGQHFDWHAVVKGGTTSSSGSSGTSDNDTNGGYGY